MIKLETRAKNKEYKFYQIIAQLFYKIRRTFEIGRRF